MSTAIEKREPSVLDMLCTPEWPRAVLDVVRKQKVPKGCTDEDWYVFMKQAQASGMNPLLGHCYCVPRRTNVGTKDKPQWVESHVFQVAIDGMRARAAQHLDFISTNAAAVWEKDLVSIDAGRGEITHKSNPISPGSRIVGAWARVEKKGAVPTVVWLPALARSGSGAFWEKDPGNMLAKCAEALALRRAYPAVLSGVHVAEEIIEAAPAVSKVDAVMGTVVSATSEAPPPPHTGPAVEFGPHRGQAISTLTPEQRAACLQEGEWLLANQKMSAKIRARLEANLAALRGGAPALPESHEPAVILEARPVSHAMHNPSAEPPDDVALPGEPGSNG